MGFTDTAPETGLPIFFNVVHAVGKQCPNIRDDVKLVQYLLISLYDQWPEARPQSELSVTGFCGPATMYWIHKFQLDVYSLSPGSILVDDRVDRIRDKATLKGAYSKKSYTLAFLNAYTASFNPTAFVATPNFVPLENAATVPGPTPDIVRGYEKPLPIPSTGGF